MKSQLYVKISYDSGENHAFEAGTMNLAFHTYADQTPQAVRLCLLRGDDLEDICPVPRKWWEGHGKMKQQAVLREKLAELFTEAERVPAMHGDKLHCWLLWLEDNDFYEIEDTGIEVEETLIDAYDSLEDFGRGVFEEETEHGHDIACEIDKYMDWTRYILDKAWEYPRVVTHATQSEPDKPVYVFSK